MSVNIRLRKSEAGLHNPIETFCRKAVTTMNKKGKLFFRSKALLGVVLCMSLMFTQVVSVSASMTDPQKRVYEVFLAGINAADSLHQLEEYFDNDYNFIPSTLNTFNYDTEWIEEARNFIDANLDANANAISAINGDAPSISSAEAHATALSYVTVCADWSIKKGRGSDWDKECVYMYLSHYVDRAEYYFNNGNLNYLLDGENMSENTSYFSKWITNEDRSVYNTYLAKVNALNAADNLLQMFTAAFGIYSNATDYVSIMKDFDRVTKEVTLFRHTADSVSTVINTVDLLSAFKEIQEYVLKDNAHTRPQDLYKLFVEDGDLLHNADNVMKDNIVKNILSLILSTISGEFAGGLIQLGSYLLRFTADEYMSIFNFAAYVSMRQSFHIREASRYYDYLYGEYL